MNKYTTVVGLDLSDKKGDFCVLDCTSGEVLETGVLTLTGAAVRHKFGRRERCLVVFETGTHSPWLQHALEDLGHGVFVADARRLKAITSHDRKSDKRDAEMLARLARADLDLMCPVSHRSRQAQADLAVLKARDRLVRARGAVIGTVRGLVKSFGERLERCSPECFAARARPQIPEALRPAVWPLLETIAQMSATIKAYDRRIEELCTQYKETERLRSVRGVGPVSALAFALVLEYPERFASGRDAAAYLGLVPRLSQSGESDPQLRITKAGHHLTRRLLVQCAQYILCRGDDSELRRWGLKLAERGGKNGKKRAVVAVARKLAVVLFTLWKNDEDFRPFPQEAPEAAKASAAAPATSGRQQQRSKTQTQPRSRTTRGKKKVAA